MRKFNQPLLKLKQKEGTLTEKERKTQIAMTTTFSQSSEQRSKVLRIYDVTFHQAETESALQKIL